MRCLRLIGGRGMSIGSHLPHAYLTLSLFFGFGRYVRVRGQPLGRSEVLVGTPHERGNAVSPLVAPVGRDVRQRVDLAELYVSVQEHALGYFGAQEVGAL